ncbi:MAG: ATP-binding protein [Polaromonas sp.]|uniref:ATP-binding protein n=1 Tax=Polaromonas sp. TaxID=1869339 RepID=UPI0027372414|nr:ATP-binding protein [Polaromonas sp.]MDP2820318.1 ATP-binding protein [Polaromonas sp.]
MNILETSQVTQSPEAVLPRLALSTVQRLAHGFPVLAVTGPRQSGKTTLARQVFPNKLYWTLEDVDTRRIAQADPRAFLGQFTHGAVLDEIQRAPELLSYLQGAVDHRGIMGDFIITGSQQFGLLESISQSLAGRVGLVELLPLSLAEMTTAPNLPNFLLNDLMFRGGYPALYDQRRRSLSSRGIEPADWHRAYLSTYIERDVRQVLGVRDLASFERFILMCAARSGQLLNIQALGADCGISTSAARQWLSVLEASYVIRLLQPWHENFGKRLVKMPKLYFLDSGLLCHLLRVESPLALATHALRGAIFETWVLAETLKHRFNQGLSADIYFWRDNHGTEVDLLYADQGLLHPVEIKSGTTFTTDWLSGCERFRRHAGARSAPGLVVYGGDSSFEVLGNRVMSWRGFGKRNMTVPAEPKIAHNAGV